MSLFGPRKIPETWLDRPILGDSRKLCREIPDRSIDLVFTDPVYSDVDAYRWLARTAARVLKPGRFCYAYVGNISVLDCAFEMRRYLDFAGIFAMVGAGGYINRWRLIGAWKPILVFSRGKPIEVPYRLNMFNSAPDKRYHRWGQGASPAYSTVKLATAPGEIVLDPFCGGGTTAAVCHALGRRFLTFDVDPEAIAVTEKRLAWKDLPMFEEAGIA